MSSLLHHPSTHAIDYYSIETYQETLHFIKQQLPASLQKIDFGIVCGSGLGGLVKCFDGETIEIDYKASFVFLL